MSPYLKPILWFSLIIPLYQGIQYVLIGSIYPLVTVSLLLSPVVLYTFFRQGYSVRVIKYWGFLHIGYGALGFSLIALGLLAGSGLPSSIYYQFNVWYVLKMGICIILGVQLLRMRKSLLLNNR